MTRSGVTGVALQGILGLHRLLQQEYGLEDKRREEGRVINARPSPVPE